MPNRHVAMHPIDQSQRTMPSFSSLQCHAIGCAHADPAGFELHDKQREEKLNFDLQTSLARIKRNNKVCYNCNYAEAVSRHLAP
jgi:hypothetical protein